MSLSKKIDLKGTLRQVFYLSEAPSPPMIPCFPLLRVYSILIHTRKGRGEITKEKFSGALFTKPVENTNIKN